MVPVEIPPGVVTKPTKAGNSSNWREVNLLRWSGGVMQPVDPWEKIGYTNPLSDVRAIHSWHDNTNRLWTAFLCNGHLYVEYNGNLVNISPTPAIEAPSADYTTGGYGDDTYNKGTYGTPRNTRPDRKEMGPTFTIDNWGQNLLVMVSSDGRLLQWVPPVSPASPAAATVVTNSPTGRTFVVTPERHVIVFDYAGIVGGFAWCDQENITDWNYAGIASKAGNHKVEPAAPIMAAKHVGDTTLFFTTKRPYTTSYTGLPYIYTGGIEVGGEGSVPVSPQCLVRALDGAIWASESGFWYFNGVSVSPVDCDIWPWIKANVDWDLARQTAIGVNMASHSELWFFFPIAGGSTNTRLAIFNYRDKWWSMGKMQRSAAFTSDFIGYPLMADGVSVYKHGSGNRYPGAVELPWAETFTVNLKGGGEFNTLRAIKPEITGDYANLRFSTAYRQRRTPDNNEKYSASRSIQAASGEVWMDVSSLDFRLRVEYINSTISDFGVGPILFDVKARGRRTV